LTLTRKPIQQRRQHVFAVTLKLLHGTEMFLARRATGLHDLVLRVYKRIQIVAMYFFSDRT
jgi:hypothetical protein